MVKVLTRDNPTCDGISSATTRTPGSGAQAGKDLGRRQGVTFGHTAPRLLVCGSRTFSDFNLMWDAIKQFVEIVGAPDVLIHGGAKGADAMAEGIAKFFAIPTLPFPISDQEWQTYGKSMGRIRNARMLRAGRPTHVMAFFAGERTRGTAHMVEIARDAGLEVREFGL